MAKASKRKYTMHMTSVKELGTSKKNNDMDLQGSRAVELFHLSYNNNGTNSLLHLSYSDNGTNSIDLACQVASLLLCL